MKKLLLICFLLLNFHNLRADIKVTMSPDSSQTLSACPGDLEHEFLKINIENVSDSTYILKTIRFTNVGTAHTQHIENGILSSSGNTISSGTITGPHITFEKLNIDMISGSSVSYSLTADIKKEASRGMFYFHITKNDDVFALLPDTNIPVKITNELPVKGAPTFIIRDLIFSLAEDSPTGGIVDKYENFLFLKLKAEAVCSDIFLDTLIFTGKTNNTDRYIEKITLRDENNIIGINDRQPFRNKRAEVKIDTGIFIPADSFKMISMYIDLRDHAPRGPELCIGLDKPEDVKLRTEDTRVILNTDGEDKLRNCFIINSVEHFSVKETGVYPQPVSDYLTVKFELKIPGGISFEILDIYGNNRINISNEYYTQGINSKILDVSLLSSGIYILKIIANKDIRSKKILIMK